MQSLRIKLIAPFVAGTFIFTLLLAWYTYSSARNAVEDAMLTVSEAKTDQTLSSMNLLFKSLSTNMHSLVSDRNVTRIFCQNNSSNSAPSANATMPCSDPGINADSKLLGDTASWLVELVENNRFIRDFLILNKEGVCVVSSNESYVGTSFADASYVHMALQGVFNFDNFNVGKVSKQFSTYFAGPIDVYGRIEGALVAIVDFPKLVNYQTDTFDSGEISTSLLSGDGVFMAHKDLQIMGNDALDYKSLYKELLVVAEKGGEVRYVMDGVDYTGYAAYEPTTRWLVITSGKDEAIFAPAYKQGLIVLSTSMVFLLLISFVVIRTGNSIINSLLSLINYAKHISDGDVDYVLPPTTRADELGVLHRSLQKLVSSLQKMLAETQAANKMKDEFLANMSHEMRTPLNAIIGMSHLALEGEVPEEKQKFYIQKIKLAAGSLLGVINDILDLSKIEAGKLAVEEVVFNPYEVLKNALDIHQEKAAAKNITLSFEYEFDQKMCFWGDPLRLGQVLNNLISNALKFTSSGSVQVRCWLDATAGENEEKQMRFRVIDTGVGIPSDLQSKLFQPFTQADASITRKFGGTGLGLAICDHLVHLMDGQIFLSSEPGKGSVFSFYIRVKVAKECSEKSESSSLFDSFGRLGIQGRRILLVEDNEINTMILEEFLEPTGAKVKSVTNGQEAVEAVKEQLFDLILMDMQMPVMGGLEATEIIRGLPHGASVPIVAITANALKEDKERGLAVGMDDYMTKPIEPSDFLKMLRKWLA